MLELNKDDLCMTVKFAGGGTAYIYDTYCKAPMSKKEKEAVDGRILTIYERALLRKRLETDSTREGQVLV